MSDEYDLAPDSPQPRPPSAQRPQPTPVSGYPPQYPQPPYAQSRSESQAFSPYGQQVGGQQILSYARPGLEPPRRNGARAMVAIVFMLILAGLSMLGLGLEAWDYSQFDAAEAGTLTVEQEQMLVNITAGWLGLYAIALLGWVISFLMWQYRAVKNVRIVTGDSRSGPGMSVGWWFIPFANIVMPWLVLSDLWSRAVRTSAPIAGTFWLLWIGGSVVERIGSSMYERGLDAGDFHLARQSIIITTISLVASVVCWLLLIYYVRTVQKAQAPHELGG